MAAGEIVQPGEPRGPDVGRGYLLQAGQVMLQAWNDHTLRLIALLGDAPPVPDLDPGWQVTPRPKRVGLTEWAGRDPARVSFEIVIDGFRGNEHSRVGHACRALEKLAGHRSGNTPPPTIMFDSLGAVPHDRQHAPHLRWVIERLEWGDALRDRRGRRVRQAAGLTLLQHVEDQDLAGLPAIQKKASEKRGRGFVDVRAGDTLRKIAARYHLSKAEIRDAKKINKIRDADAKLKVARIKLPPRAGVFGGG